MINRDIILTSLSTITVVSTPEVSTGEYLSPPPTHTETMMVFLVLFLAMVGSYTEGKAAERYCLCVAPELAEPLVNPGMLRLFKCCLIWDVRHTIPVTI